MKIYFAASVRAGRQDAALYGEIIKLLKPYGEVLTEHLGSEELTEQGEERGVEEIYRRDYTWLEQADVVVAEVTTPSLGVGLEIGSAKLLGKKVLCLYRPSVTPNLSAMILGNPHITVKEYAELMDLPPILNDFFIQT